VKLFIANWKMNFTTQQGLSYCQDNLEELKAIKNKIILCPSFPGLTVLAHALQDSGIALGGQTVSEHESGSFTGQVSAKDLAASGCTYTIIGHSEERQAQCLSNETVAQKTLRVLEAGMIPIVCIGEPQEIKDAGTTQEYLEEQLFMLKREVKGAPLYIAYEPIWAIGTGKTPSIDELKALFSNLKTFMPGSAFLYGGSVNSETIKELNEVALICGYLIGKASLDFQELKKVVS
jgi:triosephosphate isomerase (TIM)